MLKLTNVLKNLDITMLDMALEKSYKGHRHKSEVLDFIKNEESYKNEMFAALKDGSWEKYISYTEMEKSNSNGKTRHIFCPSLQTRILQHLLLVILNPLYTKVDNKNSLNCKEGCGITANLKKNSVMKRMKNIFYDKRHLKYGLIIDQRKCYEHVHSKLFRKYLKKFTDDKWLIDFAVKICFVNDELPIGTPTSPFVHNLIMLEFDYWVKSVSKNSVRYADDNFIAFETKEEANAMKWRIMNFWWYNFHIRAKRHTIRIFPLDDTPTYFCGYIYVRNSTKTVCDHNKGYTRIRRMTAKKAKKVQNGKSFASYYGMLKHADAYKLIKKITNKKPYIMDFAVLQKQIKLDRGKFDVKTVDIREIVGIKISLIDYEIRYGKTRDKKISNDNKKLGLVNEKKSSDEPKGLVPNWIKCIIMIDEIDEFGNKTGRKLAREFHGNYTYLIDYLLKCEKTYPKEKLIPIYNTEIEFSGGFIFKGSTNQIEYFE